MTKQELDEIRARWGSAQSFKGIEGITHMLEDIPKLLDEVERLQNELDDMRLEVVRVSYYNRD